MIFEVEAIDELAKEPFVPLSKCKIGNYDSNSDHMVISFLKSKNKNER